MIDLLPNPTIVCQWVLFMVAVFTLHFGIFRPTLRIIQERKNRTEGEKESAHSLESQCHDMTAQVEKRMEEARIMGARKKDERRLAAEKFTEELLKRTRGELEKKMEETRLTVEKESKEAAMQLRQQVRSLAHDITVKVLEREI